MHRSLRLMRNRDGFLAHTPRASAESPLPIALIHKSSRRCSACSQTNGVAHALGAFAAHGADAEVRAAVRAGRLRRTLIVSAITYRYWE